MSPPPLPADKRTGGAWRGCEWGYGLLWFLHEPCRGRAQRRVEPLLGEILMLGGRAEGSRADKCLQRGFAVKPSELLCGGWAVGLGPALSGQSLC